MHYIYAYNAKNEIDMQVFIQYPLVDNTWSDWARCSVVDGQFLLHGRALDYSYVRVLKDENPERPHVSWFILHQNSIYEVTKSKTGHIEKAIPIEDKTLKPIGIDKLSGDFSIQAYIEMFNDAKAFLAPPILTAEDVETLMLRPADTVQSMALTAAAMPEQSAKNWWKNLYERYRKDVEAQLMNIIEQPLTRNQQIETLQLFLKAHYEFVQGTCLDYVAIPHHPVTRTLCEIATRLATAEISAIEILMPGVAVEPIQHSNVKLSALPLSEALQSHIALTPQYLMPVKSLNDVITHPQEPLYCPYWLDDYRPYKATPSDIQALFEHSETTRELRDAFLAYQSLIIQDDSLLGQLNILGHKLKIYDAHGGIGQNESAASGAYPAIMNFMEYYLNLEPCSLIMTQTPPSLEDLPESCHIAYAFYNNSLYFISGYEQTISLITTPEHLAKFSVNLARYNNLENVPSNIKTPIIIKTDDNQYTFFPGQHPIDASLIDINFPQEYQRIIHLSEASIPKDIFDAIQRTGFESPFFAALFLQRCPDSKMLSVDDLAFIDIHTEHSFMSGYSRIPKALRDEIELLWQLFHNPVRNIEATRNIATCIGTRGEQIRSLSKQFEQELIKISTNPETKMRLLQEAKSYLNTQLTIFNRDIPAGCDKHLRLNIKILNRYQKTISIQSLADCYQLNHFNSWDLKIILESNPRLVENFKAQFYNFENYVLYMSDAPLQTLEVVIPFTLQILKNNFGNFDVILEVLGAEKKQLLMTQLPNIIHSISDFINVIEKLSLEQRIQAVEALKARWPKIIHDGMDFFRVTHKLDPEARKPIYEALSADWPDIINNAANLNAVIANINHEQRIHLINCLKHKLPLILQGCWSFWQATMSLTPDERKPFMEMFNSQWTKMIRSDSDFCDATQHLTPEERKQIIEALKDEWPNIINTGWDFYAVTENLTSEEKLQVTEYLNINWISIIMETKGDDSIQETIHFLNFRSRNDVFGEIATLQYTIQKFSEGIKALSNYCEEDAIENFLTAILAQDAEFINSAFRALFNSQKKDSIQSIFTKPNIEEEITRIIRVKFPVFCNKHIQNNPEESIQCAKPFTPL